MKLLFDQNLAPKLATRLADLFPGSSHVQSASLDRATDDQVGIRAAKWLRYCVQGRGFQYPERGSWPPAKSHLATARQLHNVPYRIGHSYEARRRRVV